VQFADPQVFRLLQLANDVLGAEHVSPGIARFGLEGAELAMGVADVGIGEAATHHEIGLETVLLQANLMRHGPDAGQIRALIEQKAVLKGKTLSPLNLPADRQQTDIAEVAFQGQVQARHEFLQPSVYPGPFADRPENRIHYFWDGVKPWPGSTALIPHRQTTGSLLGPQTAHRRHP